MAMIHRTSTRSRRRLAAWSAAAGCGLWLLAQAVPADAQASRTRPGGGSSSGSSASGGGSSSSSSGGGSSAGSSSGGSSGSPVRVQRTRPPDGSSGSPTVIDQRRPPERSRGGSFRGGFHGGFHSHRHIDFFWPYGWGWWLGWNWSYPYWGYPNYGYYGYGAYGAYGYPPPSYPHRGGYPYSSGPGMGALDTDVWPSRTQIWIDGRYVGFVDQFDGWPRYLWLPRGTYDVVFYLEGFQTLARQYTVYPGLVIDVEDRLEPGEAIHPTELAPAETPRRDARERAEREQRAAAGEPEWRQRVRADREEALERAPDAADGGWVFLGVRPADAAVYLDGEFVGTGGELSGRRGLAVEPGTHELSVVRPGYASHTLEFEIEPGGELDLDVALEES